MAEPLIGKIYELLTTDPQTGPTEQGTPLPKVVTEEYHISIEEGPELEQILFAGDALIDDHTEGSLIGMLVTSYFNEGNTYIIDAPELAQRLQIAHSAQARTLEQYKSALAAEGLQPLNDVQVLERVSHEGLPDSLPQISDIYFNDIGFSMRLTKGPVSISWIYVNGSGYESIKAAIKPLSIKEIFLALQAKKTESQPEEKEMIDVICTKMTEIYHDQYRDAKASPTVVEGKEGASALKAISLPPQLIYRTKPFLGNPFVFASTEQSRQYFSQRVIEAAVARDEGMTAIQNATGPGPHIMEMNERHKIAEIALLVITQDGYKDPRCVPLITQIVADNPRVFGIIHVDYLMRAASYHPELREQLVTIAQTSIFNGTVFYEASEDRFPDIHAHLFGSGVVSAYSPQV